MDSRLSRWSVATVVAIGVAMALLLPPGISPLVTWYQYQPFEPTNALDAALFANRVALSGAQFDLHEVTFARQLQPFLAAGRSPTVLRYAQQTLASDPALTAVADSLWRTIPHHPAAPRTVLVSSEWNPAVLRVPAPSGVCYAAVMPRGRGETPITALRAGAGGCLLATQFGPPGKGLATWLATGREYRLPGSVPRLDGPVRTLHAMNTPWVTGHQFDPEGAWWSMDPPVSACLAGRSEFCVEALDLGPARTVSGRWAFYRQSVGLSVVLPAELLSDLGPERFATVWRSDDPLPVAYTKVTGRPFDEWAMHFAQHVFGRLVVETALSWSGWAGWAFWMALLFGWLVVRMREQPAQ